MTDWETEGGGHQKVYGENSGTAVVMAVDGSGWAAPAATRGELSRTRVYDDAAEDLLEKILKELRDINVQLSLMTGEENL